MIKNTKSIYKTVRNIEKLRFKSLTFFIIHEGETGLFIVDESAVYQNRIKFVKVL